MLVEQSTCYFNFRALLRAHQVKIVQRALHLTAGPDIAQFRRCWPPSGRGSTSPTRRCIIRAGATLSPAA